MGLMGVMPAANAPAWLFSYLHLALFWAPFLLVAVALLLLAKIVLARWKKPHGSRVESAGSSSIEDLPKLFMRFVLAYSRRDQIALVVLGLIAMPPLYLSLELPKIIINEAISSKSFPVSYLGLSLSQGEFLIVLCAAFLFLVLFNGALKYRTNAYKGRVLIL